MCLLTWIFFSRFDLVNGYIIKEYLMSARTTFKTLIIEIFWYNQILPMRKFVPVEEFLNCYRHSCTDYMTS